ncbi:hypothetical protein LINPERPRIM_LOCUS16741 [Linum perenne]
MESKRTHSATGSSTSNRLGVRKCHHNTEALLKVAGTQQNRGRPFYRCPFWRSADCGYFLWADERPFPAKIGADAESCSRDEVITPVTAELESTTTSILEKTEEMEKNTQQLIVTLEKMVLAHKTVVDELRLARNEIGCIEARMPYLMFTLYVLVGVIGVCVGMYLWN